MGLLQKQGQASVVAGVPTARRELEEDQSACPRRLQKTGEGTSRRAEDIPREGGEGEEGEGHRRVEGGEGEVGVIGGWRVVKGRRERVIRGWRPLPTGDHGGHPAPRGSTSSVWAGHAAALREQQSPRGWGHTNAGALAQRSQRSPWLRGGPSFPRTPPSHFVQKITENRGRPQEGMLGNRPRPH